MELKNILLPKIQSRKTKQTRLMLLSNCAICGKKNQLLLKIKKLIVFQMDTFKNEIINKFNWVETNLCQNFI